MEAQQVQGAHWGRGARGHELKLYTRTEGIVQLDGFKEEDHELLGKTIKTFYKIPLEVKEHTLRGWNWGKGHFGKEEMQFEVQNKPAFEIPYDEISNTNLASKTEVAVELRLLEEGDTDGVMTGGARKRGRKAGGGRDQLVEIRFYVPGVVKKEADGSDAEADNEEGDEDAEEQSAATLFYNTITEKAEVGEVAGDSFATFENILHLIPRGRFEIDMYETSFRLRGKTYDYRVQYEAVKKFIILNRPDDLHVLIAIGMEPPLRQGQTRYPFIVMQFNREEEQEIDLNITEEALNEKYKDRLQSRYEGPMHLLIAQIYRGLTGKRTHQPSKDFTSHHQQQAVKCSIKASEGHLYCLDRALIFVPKPATYVSFDSVASVTMGRVGGAISASRTFDLTVTMKGGLPEHQFSNINKEEQQPLEDFFRTKSIRVKNELVDDSITLIKQALAEEGVSDSDEEVVKVARGGSAEDEDSETPDEDFAASSESDVAEEFDSDAMGSDSDAGSDGRAAPVAKKQKAKPATKSVTKPLTKQPQSNGTSKDKKAKGGAAKESHLSSERVQDSDGSDATMGDAEDASDGEGEERKPVRKKQKQKAK